MPRLTARGQAEHPSSAGLFRADKASRVRVVLISRPMPGILGALVAFVHEDQRCGELAGALDNGYVWLARSCGGEIAHPAAAPPPAPART